MATEQENGIRAVVSNEKLVNLYPDEITRHALVRAVDGYERQGVIKMARAETILLLGEPAVYGALAAVREQAALVTPEHAGA